MYWFDNEPRNLHLDAVAQDIYAFQTLHKNQKPLMRDSLPIN